MPTGDELQGADGAIESSLRPEQLNRSKRGKFIGLLNLSILLMNLASEVATVSNNLHDVDVAWMLLRNAPLIAGCIKEIRRIVSSPES